MVGDEDVFEDIQYLTGSPQRVAILDALCADPTRPTDLSDRVDATRTTVQRVLSGFLDRNWVVKRDGLYRATDSGRRVRDAYADFEGTISRAREVGPIVATLGEDCDDLPDAAYENGSAIVASEQEPLAAVERLVEWFEEGEGEHIRVLTPIVASTFNRTAASLLTEGTTFDMVIDTGVLERSATDFPEALERAVEHGGVDVVVHPEPLSFGLTIREDSAVVSGYDATNNLRGLIISDDPAMMGWARDTFDRIAERAMPLKDALSEFQ